MHVWRWAEPCHNVPSPRVGEGQGGGYNAHCICFVPEAQQKPAVALKSVRSTSFTLGLLSPPPSLPLPHHKGVHARLRRGMGGGNPVALTFATHAMCLRVH